MHSIIVWGHKSMWNHLIVAHKHPHHYVTAGCITCFCIVTHRFDDAMLWGTWVYAFFETCVSGTMTEKIAHLPEPVEEPLHLHLGLHNHDNH